MPSVSNRRPLLAALAVCVAFFVGVFAYGSRDPDVLNHGDPHSDIRAIIAAHQFRRVGMSTLHFLQTEDGGAEISLVPAYYARHPALGAMGLALLQRAGVSLRASRFLPLLASTLGVFGMFLFFRVATGNGWMGVLGAAAYASLAPIWLLADSFSFHSWPLAAKPFTLWLIAGGCVSAGTARWWRFGAAALSVAATIVLCGIETMPSIGFLAFFLPFALVGGRTWERFGVALQCAASVGIGMVAGLGLRLWNMSQPVGSDLGSAVENFSTSLKFRSSLNEVYALPVPYPIEMIRRVWVYAPHVFVLLAMALAATAVVRARTGRWPRWPVGGVVAAALVSEGLYFVGMRNHATEHYHTLTLLALTMTAVTTSCLALLGELLPRDWPRSWRAAGTAAVLLVSVFFAPLHNGTYTNVRTNKAHNTGKPLQDEAEAVARLLPRESVVIVATRGSELFDYGAELALHEHTMVILGHGLWQRDWGSVLANGRASGRPLFAMVHREGVPEAMSAVAAIGRPVAAGRLVCVYALANFDPAALPIATTTMLDSVLKETAFISPTAAELAAAGIKNPFYGRTTRGVWMSAPAEIMATRATVGIVPFRPDPGFFRISAATADFSYARHPEVLQPPVVVGFRVRPKVGAAQSRGDLSVEKNVKPGETVECRVPIPEGVDVSEFEIWARRPDGERSIQSAAVNCKEIRFEHR